PGTISWPPTPELHGESATGEPSETSTSSRTVGAFVYVDESKSPTVPAPAEVRREVWEDAHRGHPKTQNAVTRAAEAAGAMPLEPELQTVIRVDTGWTTQGGTIWLCEAKSLHTNAAGKIRLGLG